MRRDTILSAVTIGGVTVGLAVLLYGEFAHLDALIPAGGVIVLLSVAVLTGFIARL